MQITANYVHTNGIKIHYHRIRSSHPPLVMSHGVTDNGLCMLRLAEHLMPKYDVILVDARGHGLSDAPDWGYSADHHADDLAGLILKLGLRIPILYGHSMGARTITRLAAKYPEIPKAVILEDPVQILPPTEFELANRDAWLEEMAKEIPQWKEIPLEVHLEAAKQQGHPDWTLDEQIEWGKARRQVSPKVFEIGSSMHHIRNDFDKIICPTLILKADADQETKQKNENAVSAIKNCKIIHVAGAGHNIRRDDFTATTKYIDDFLNSL